MAAGRAKVLMGEIVGIGVTVANVGTRVADMDTVYVATADVLQELRAMRSGPLIDAILPTSLLASGLLARIA
jgi:hypothetical protein